MQRVKKIALILLIWLFAIYLISVIQTSPITISVNDASFFQLPMVFWLIMLVSPFLLYIIAKDSKNPLIPMLCVIFYFFFFYSYGLYFMVHPTNTDIQNSVRFLDMLSSTTHIGSNEILMERYFSFPVYFIFSKMFASSLSISPIQTCNIGFFSLFLMLPIVLPLFYKRKGKTENISLYFIAPALYLTLSWHFINDQFVPQFLGLVYLFILFGFYQQYQKDNNPLYVLLIIIFYSLAVFTHPFIHIFFLVFVIFEKVLSKLFKVKKQKIVSSGIIMALLGILVPYIGVYWLMLGNPTAETWRLFQRIVAERDSVGNGYRVQPLYNLVPKIYDQYFSPITKYIMVAAIILIGLGFLFYFLKKRKLLDLNVLLSSASWFVLGLTNLVLGQRALQVAMLPLARHFRYPYKFFSILSKIVVVIILVAPSLFVANLLINMSINGDRYIQDPEENLLGTFTSKHIINETILLHALNPYPVRYPSEGISYRVVFEKPGGYNWDRIDIVLDSPKLKKDFMYRNTTLPRDIYDSVVYDNRDIEMVVK